MKWLKGMSFIPRNIFESDQVAVGNTLTCVSIKILSVVDLDVNREEPHFVGKDGPNRQWGIEV